MKSGISSVAPDWGFVYQPFWPSEAWVMVMLVSAMVMSARALLGAFTGRGMGAVMPNWMISMLPDIVVSLMDSSALRPPMAAINLSTTAMASLFTAAGACPAAAAIAANVAIRINAMIPVLVLFMMPPSCTADPSKRVRSSAILNQSP